MNAQPAHGSPEDRGSADRYYGRQPSPHYYKDGKRIPEAEMTAGEVNEYLKGYREEEDRKQFD